MKLLVLGATGGTGMEIVCQAAEHGHAVTAFCKVAGAAFEAVSPNLDCARQFVE